ncbi:hypothetical protein Thiowin_00655 [Thiorhodovibrio winogradskyi]|uniref:Uncharacterized protein n=1 Tax=Thiorhodovibrio winogradskyi TaxID=77007 RepID=A0ABZ0S507_9GAMM|nr:hypothetical protein [Thiorhodovibrio winogradskyi]
MSQEDFCGDGANFSSQCTHVKARIRESVLRLSEAEKQRLKDGTGDLQRTWEWQELTHEERGNALDRLDGLGFWATDDFGGLKRLLAPDYDINNTLVELKQSLQRQGQDRLRKRVEREQAKEAEGAPVKL